MAIELAGRQAHQRVQDEVRQMAVEHERMERLLERVRKHRQRLLQLDKQLTKDASGANPREDKTRTTEKRQVERSPSPKETISPNLTGETISQSLAGETRGELLSCQSHVLRGRCVFRQCCGRRDDNTRRRWLPLQEEGL